MKADIKSERQPREGEMQICREKVVLPCLFLPQKPGTGLYTKVAAAFIIKCLTLAKLTSFAIKKGERGKQN